MIVSSSEPTIDDVCSTGYKFAGMYRIAADNSNAQVRATESGLRLCSGEPQTAVGFDELVSRSAGGGGG